MLYGLPTSYSEAHALTYGTVQDLEQVQQQFPPSAHLCDDYGDRLAAAACTLCTYITHPQSTRHIPLGETYRNFNTSTKRKRVLNCARIVTIADNVKQHAYTHPVL